MPTKIYFPGGASVLVKGQTKRLAIYYGPPIIRWFRRWAQAVAVNGHDLAFQKRNILCLEHQLDAEYDAQIAGQKKAEEERAKMSHCRRCGRDNPHEATFCMNCSAPLVKKEEPKRIIPVGGA